jgi:hypothetical protein
VRWAAGAPNCTLGQDDRGRTEYGLSSRGLNVVLAVDPQELQKISRRASPMLSVLLTFRYEGGESLDLQPAQFTLEFTKHYEVTKRALDPSVIVRNLQQNVDDLTDQVERHEVRKHPEQKQEKEAELQARLKDYTELTDFVSTNALHPAVLNAGSASAAGWVFFPVKDRWIGPWRKPEKFVLRLPIRNEVIELPFSLPPEQRHFELRHRAGP